MKYIGSLAFLLGFIVGCTSEPTQREQRDDVAAVTSSDVADTNSGLYAWKVHIEWYRDPYYTDRAQIDEWINVRAGNHVEAQFKAVDYSQYVHFTGKARAAYGVWAMPLAPTFPKIPTLPLISRSK